MPLKVRLVPQSSRARGFLSAGGLPTTLLPLAPSQSAVFRGDNEELLDHLLVACHGHKMNKPLESCGRDLVPFFAPGESLEPNQVTRCAAQQQGHYYHFA